jgi:hypothetical protein
MKTWWQNWEVSHLASKGVGMLSSVLASHMAVLMATPDYANFWASFSLTAPQIIDKAAFEAKLTSLLAAGWLIIDHFLWKFQENQAVTGSPTVQVEKAAPVLGGARATDPPKA